MSEVLKMAERLVKCPACGKQNWKADTIEHSKRYYCKPCYAEKQKPKERTAWDDLFDMIVATYGFKPTAMMYKQLKDYREKHKFTDVGMTYTLRYMYQVLNLNVKEDAGLGLILYYYEEAKRYYGELFRLKEVAQQFERNEKEVIIEVKRYEEITTHKAFDYDSINWEEDEDE